MLVRLGKVPVGEERERGRWRKMEGRREGGRGREREEGEVKEGR